MKNEKWGKNFKLEVTERMVSEEDIARNKTKGDRLEVFIQPGFSFTSPYKLRRRKRGDKFKPLGTQGYQKLKKFLLAKRVDKSLRDDWPLIVDSFDNIVWVIGLEISEDARVTNFFYPVLHIRVIEEEPDSFPRS